MSILDWLEKRVIDAELKTKKIKLSEINDWIISDETIKHKTGRFFSIVGVKAVHKKTNATLISQPIINQPEIGILGFIFARSNEGNKILLQAKTEPGNTNGTQIAPTVQATFSNYMQVHNGKPTLFLEHFITNDILKVEGTLQSEQGTRFLGKYNRNISVFLESENIISASGNWKWFSLKDLLEILDTDYSINTDARSVLVTSDWKALCDNKDPFSININQNEFGEHLYRSYNSHANLDDLLKTLNEKRASINFETQVVGIGSLTDWYNPDGTISKKPLFMVSGVSVSVKGREVENWDQPLLESYSEGNVVLYCKKINNILHFLVGFSTEIGFKEHVQFGPSIAQIDGEKSAILNIPESETTTIASYRQSDEGGRFFNSVMHYQLIEINENAILQIDNNHVWMTLGQIVDLLPQKGNFTNEFRSVLSLILKYL